MPIQALDATAIRELLGRAAVPEHSPGFMRAMSGGIPFCRDGWLFLTDDDWLMAIGYALDGQGQTETPANFAEALEAAVRETGARSCFAIGPELPERLVEYVTERDVIYILDLADELPSRPLAQAARAEKELRVSEDREFTAAHRRLWAEFLGRANMKPNVRELYARAESVLAAARAAESAGEGALLDLRLLNAWDGQGNLTACLLLDYSPERFCSYIIGAHSKKHYAPHATDLLFASMIATARAEGKRFIHLGLGVNPGITRFKRKWGGRVSRQYAMAAWEERGEGRGRSVSGLSGDDTGKTLRVLLTAPSTLSKQQIFDTFPQQRPFGMIFEVRKGAARSWLCGSAHFFRYSFEFAFRKLFEPLHTVIFEGPLDEAFLAQVETSGRTPEPDAPRVADALSEDEIRRIERAVYGPEGRLARLLGMQQPRRADVRGLLSTARPWFAFFSIWVAYLEGRGWHESVDLEAWNTAKDMGKAVIAMENFDEQIASLESVPIPRIRSFLLRCNEWPSFMKRNVRTYLAGDLQAMVGSSIEFPSRTEQVIDLRDERFRQRMRPFLEAGDCAVFVGTAHLIGLIPMLEQDGFTVLPVPKGLRAKLRSWSGK